MSVLSVGMPSATPAIVICASRVRTKKRRSDARRRAVGSLSRRTRKPICGLLVRLWQQLVDISEFARKRNAINVWLGIINRPQEDWKRHHDNKKAAFLRFWKKDRPDDGTVETNPVDLSDCDTNEQAGGRHKRAAAEIFITAVLHVRVQARFGFWEEAQPLEKLLISVLPSLNRSRHTTICEIGEEAAAQKRKISLTIRLQKDQIPQDQKIVIRPRVTNRG